MYVQYSIKSSMCVLIYVKVLLSIDIHLNQYNCMYIHRYMYILRNLYVYMCTYVCVCVFLCSRVGVGVGGWVGRCD